MSEARPLAASLRAKRDAHQYYNQPSSFFTSFFLMSNFHFNRKALIQRKQKLYDFKNGYAQQKKNQLNCGFGGNRIHTKTHTHLIHMKEG